MDSAERTGPSGPCEGKGLWRAARLVGVLALTGGSLLLAPMASATGLPSKHRTAASPARVRALRAYDRYRALRANHRHKRGKGPRARRAVVGGTPATIEQLPWQVAVFAKFEFEGVPFEELCGGSIIDLSHVVTAGHCAFDPVTEQPLAPTSVMIVAGVSRITEEEIKHGSTAQERSVAGVRVHPDFKYPGTADDVAVLRLATPLTASSAVQAIGLPPSSAAPPEGTNLLLSGFGVENTNTFEVNGGLYSLGTQDLGVFLRGAQAGLIRRCGGEANALFVCASNSGGTSCIFDEGGPVTQELNGSPTLVGVIDEFEFAGEELCPAGAIDGFVNLAAPEVRDFVEGSETPPLAPRGGGAIIEGVLRVGDSLSCTPGSWSNAPTFTYAFVNGANNQVLQRGSSPTYPLSAADVGRTILCEVQASNAGGTGVGRTPSLSAIQPAPPPPSTPLPSAPAQPAPTPPPANSLETEPNSEPSEEESHAAAPSASQITAQLGQALTAAAREKITTLRKTGGFAVTFKALEAGKAVIDWYQVPRGAKLAKAKPEPVLDASGQRTFSAAGTAKISVKLTDAGKNLLKKSKTLKLTAKAVFTPTGKAPVITTKVFVLKG